MTGEDPVICRKRKKNTYLFQWPAIMHCDKRRPFVDSNSCGICCNGTVVRQNFACGFDKTQQTSMYVVDAASGVMRLSS